MNWNRQNSGKYDMAAYYDDGYCQTPNFMEPSCSRNSTRPTAVGSERPFQVKLSYVGRNTDLEGDEPLQQERTDDNYANFDDEQIHEFVPDHAHQEPRCSYRNDNRDMNYGGVHLRHSRQQPRYDGRQDDYGVEPPLNHPFFEGRFLEQEMSFVNRNSGQNRNYGCQALLPRPEPLLSISFGQERRHEQDPWYDGRRNDDYAERHTEQEFPASGPVCVDYGHGKQKAQPVLSNDERNKLLNSKNLASDSSKNFLISSRKRPAPPSVEDDKPMQEPAENILKCCIRCKSVDHSKLSSNKILSRDIMQKTLSRFYEKFLECLDESRSLVADENCFEKHSQVYHQIKTLVFFDKCFEQSIWDYDPKFTFDYLPDTKRGADDPDYFVCGKTYEVEENKWLKYEEIIEKQNKAKAKFLLNVAKYKGTKDEVSARFQMDRKCSFLYELIESEIKFPEEGVTDEYCTLCDDAFMSVLASMEHYGSESHTNSVRSHFVDGLIKLKAIKPGEENQIFVENTIRHFEKRYKTKPSHWMCELCYIVLNSEDHGRNHFEGSSHKRKAREGLTGAKLYESAVVVPIDPNGVDEDDLNSKKLRMAPGLSQTAKESYYVGSTKPKKKSHSYVGQFGPKTVYSGHFGH